MALISKDSEEKEPCQSPSGQGFGNGAVAGGEGEQERAHARGEGVRLAIGHRSVTIDDKGKGPRSEPPCPTTVS